jgi:hypothetical protein
LNGFFRFKKIKFKKIKKYATHFRGSFQLEVKGDKGRRKFTVIARKSRMCPGTKQSKKKDN